MCSEVSSGRNGVGQLHGGREVIWVLKNEQNGGLDLKRASEGRQVGTSISSISGSRRTWAHDFCVKGSPCPGSPLPAAALGLQGVSHCLAHDGQEPSWPWERCWSYHQLFSQAVDRRSI